MRQLKKNKQILYASRPRSNNLIDANGNRLVDAQGNNIVYYRTNEIPKTEDIYARDENGEIIYTDVDGELIPVLSETIARYEPPTRFKANISFNSGETQMAEYGLDVSGYHAVISAKKGEFDFDEKTLIWHTSEPVIDDDGCAIPSTADYRVVAIKTSLNEERFYLKKRVDDE